MFRPIGQNVRLPVDQLIRAIDNGLEATAADVLIDFKVTTQTWKAKPKFTTTTPRQYERLTSTVNEIYFYVNHGTRPHIIRPKNAPALRFQEGYNAKTRVGVIASTSGGAFGRTIYSQEVHHPGTDGRFFDRAIADKWGRGNMQRVMQRAIMAAL